MSQGNLYYKHSGAIGLMGPVYMLVFGVVSAVILGAIYAYLIYYIPFIYLNFFFTLGCGGIVGYLVGLGAKLGKTRNPTVVVLIGLIVGLLASYVGWVVWLYALTEHQALLLMPNELLQFLGLIAVDGVWSLFGWTPTGMALYAVWALEAIMIVGLCATLAWTVVNMPFCERCNKWIEAEESIGPLAPIANPDELKAQLERGDYTFFDSLKKNTDAESSHAKVSIRHCPGCLQAFFLSVKSVAVKLDSDKKKEEEETTIIENLIISSDLHRRIKAQA